MSPPRYVLDANVFIQANNEYYPLGFVPGFWDTLADQAEAGTLGSIDRVRRELEREPDELWDWVRREFNEAFYSTSGQDVLSAYKEIITWTSNEDQYYDFAKREFATVADAWLVAYAVAKECIVVTQEVLAPGIRRAIKIPNVCVEFGVEYIDTFELVRTLDVRWVNRS